MKQDWGNFYIEAGYKSSGIYKNKAYFGIRLSPRLGGTLSKTEQRGGEDLYLLPFERESVKTVSRMDHEARDQMELQEYQKNKDQMTEDLKELDEYRASDARLGTIL